MKKSILIFICLCFIVILQAQNPLRISTVDKAPYIDGYIDELDDPWGSPYVYWSTFIDLSVRNTNSTTTGLNGKFSILVRWDALYIAIVVQDATPNNDTALIPNSYERDCSEIYISMDTVTEPNGAYKAGCWLIRTQREGVTLCDGISEAKIWSIETLLNDPDFKVVSESSQTEYCQEFKLPFYFLAAGMNPIWDGRYFRFDIAISDNTTGASGGRTEQRYWYGNNGKGDDSGRENVRSFGIAKLPCCLGYSSTMEINPSTVILDASGGSHSKVNVKNYFAWTATSNQTWLKVNPEVGIGYSSTDVTLTAEVNPTNEIRRANITISTPGSGYGNGYIYVTQKAETVGISSEMEENLNLFPNPTFDEFTISGLKEKATIYVTDLNGRLKLKNEVEGNENISLRFMEKGIYIVRIQTDFGSFQRKIVLR